MTEWGADEHMTPFEGLMWRSEANPRLRSTGVLMQVLDGAPDHERLLAAHEWGTRALPRLRKRVIEDPFGLTSPRWVVDRDFDLFYHLRVVSLPAPGTMEQVLELAQALAMSPFDRSRPLWEAVLVEGLDDGRAAYLLKLHHGLADGQGTIQMLDILHGDSSEPSRTENLPVPPAERVNGTELLVRGLAGAPRKAVGELLKTAGRVTSAADRIARDPGSIAGGARYARSLARVLGPAPAPGSPLLEQRSLGRRFGILEIPVADLRAAGKAVDGSLNDAFLGALSGGMRRYHEHHGVAIDEVTAALPVSLRRDDDPLGSNRFAGARIALPVSEPDPAARMRAISERVRAARDEPALDFMGALAPALSRLPGAISGPMTERVTRTIDIQASNVRGLERPAYLAGARVLRTFPFGAAPGPAAMITLFSHEGTCCIGVNVDAAAVPDHELFVRCIEEGLAEVAALAGPSGRKSAAA
jgi:WS/DGAT/MGAT family acyltransferase